MTFLVVALQLLVMVFAPPTQNPSGGAQGPPEGGHYVRTDAMQIAGVQIGELGMEGTTDQATVACTFENPKFAGQCVENVTPDDNQSPVQACNVVLSCLNNPRCVKVYCNATTLRAGWTLVSATPVDQ